MESVVLTAGALSMILLEGIKYVLRKWILKDENFDFSLAFYGISLPVLNAIMPVPLLWLGIVTEAPILGMDLISAVKYILIILLGSVVSLGSYKVAVKPLKERYGTKEV